MTARQFVAWRKKNHLTQQHIADVVGVTRVTVARWCLNGTPPGRDFGIYALFPQAVD
jgi:transcriptional regulator with XRE-family HTH domain